MKSMKSPLLASSSSLYLLVLLVLPLIAEAGQRRVHITDDLDDVVDDEEDEEWKQWGQRSRPAPSDLDPPPDFSKMELSQIQEEMMRRHVAPTFGFVKLRLGIRRDRESVSEIATRWNKVLKTGGIEATFNPVDLNTMMFTLLRGQDTMDMKEFLLDQTEAYEVKIGDRTFRRPGDPSLDEIVERLKAEEEEADDEGVDQDTKEEL